MRSGYDVTTSKAKWALKGFQRSSLLAPSGSTTLRFVLTRHDLSTVLADGSRIVTPGKYTVQLGGGHPRDARVPSTPAVASITIDGSSCPTP
jgi:hypothetical protein